MVTLRPGQGHHRGGHIEDGQLCDLVRGAWNRQDLDSFNTQEKWPGGGGGAFKKQSL